MRKFLKTIRRTFSHRGFLVSEAAYMKVRKADVLYSLLSPVSPMAERPYIEGGLYEWYVEDRIKLDFFFPPENGKNPLAVRITGRHHGQFNPDAVPSRAYWAAMTEEDAFIADVCRRAGIPLLIVNPNDPVDPFSISNKLRTLLN